MKRKIVAKLLAGCLSVAMISPLAVQAASVEQTADVQSVEQATEEKMGEESVQTETETVTEKEEIPQTETEEEVPQTEEAVKKEKEEADIPAEKEEMAEQELLSGQSSQEKKKGWEQVENRWRYTREDGTRPQEEFENIKGKNYYFDREGWMVTGWQQIEKKWYYFDESGAMLTGWQWVKGKCYFMKDDGVMEADTWIGEYYVDKSGAWIPGKSKENHQSGWIQNGNRWWYRHSDGSYTKSDWENINGKWYYFDENGWMVTGWLKKGNNYYYLKENGAKASNYWVGNTGVGGYYINKYGVMVANSTYSVGDYIYSFNESGMCTAKENRYVRVKDQNGRTYKVEKQFETDPQVGVDVTEDEFLAAAVYTEAGNQGMPGMTGVALVMLNRMNTTREGAASPYPSQANIMIYQAQQFEVARNGSLTKWLKNIKSSQLDNAKAAVKEARRIINEYNTNKTPRTVKDLKMPEGKTDFNYMGFMTPKAFENANLDWEKTEAFTYLNTTFYTTWIKKK